MIKLGFEIGIVPFSAKIIKERRLHIVDEDELGGSSIVMALDDPEVRKPERFAICFANGRPVGVGVVFIVQLVDNRLLAYDDLRNVLTHGFLNVYVSRHGRRQGIGKKTSIERIH